MTRPGRPRFRPFAPRGRRAVAAILVTIGLVSVLSLVISTRATSRSQHQAAVVEVATRQRALTERYLNDILSERAGIDDAAADAAYTEQLLHQSARALLEGGTAPGVNGDDDETHLTAATDPTVRAQLDQEARLVNDLTATGKAILTDHAIDPARVTAGERLVPSAPIERLRILAALASNVSLNAARTIATQADRNVSDLLRIQIVLGVAGLLISVGLGIALIAAARRQTAHFRSLVTSSTDLVLVFSSGRCVYASESVTEALGCGQADLLGEGILAKVNAGDRAAVRETALNGEPREILFRLENRFGEWRHLEAHVTDLRDDRHVRGVVLNARDISERVRLEKELTRQAFHDMLTGLPNRALFGDRLDQAVSRSTRSGASLAVLLLDLDGFKQVNDSLGHNAGDRLLGKVAERFGEVKRASDTLARLGGDEFAVLLEGANEVQAVSFAERLLEHLADPFSVAGHELAVSTCIGIVVGSGDTVRGEDLIRDADVAMYAAKENGRGQYEIYRHEMAREFGEVLGLEHELRLGLGRGEVSVHYQPEIDIGSGTIAGLEALLRWRSPTRGNVSPAQFIPIAEASDLIFPLGEFVLRQACEQTASWERDGLLADDFVTWVNLSGRQLSAGGVSTLVRSELAAAGLSPARLGLEVTETAIIQGAPGDQARDELEELHALGIRIAIDDFGTGFSALGQLRNFPVDMLKVDRSFVQGVEHDAKDAAITANLVNLAHTLGLVAVAEGIESSGQLESVRTVGCDLAQGFLFARPSPATEITELLRADSPPRDHEAPRPALAPKPALGV